MIYHFVDITSIDEQQMDKRYNYYLINVNLELNKNNLGPLCVCNKCIHLELILMKYVFIIHSNNNNII